MAISIYTPTGDYIKKRNMLGHVRSEIVGNHLTAHLWPPVSTSMQLLASEENTFYCPVTLTCYLSPCSHDKHPHKLNANNELPSSVGPRNHELLSVIVKYMFP